MARNPLQVNYLGSSGSTQDCVNAMVTILTSPYKSDRMSIIVLFCRASSTSDYYYACFVVWRWWGENITIVPDGFGTHGGEGGGGLLEVLNLIKLYKVPIKDMLVERSFFDRILSGQLTDADFDELERIRDSSNSWEIPGIYTQISYIDDEAKPYFPLQLPVALIEPEFYKNIPKMIEELEEEEDLGMIVFKIAKKLESIIRKMGNYPAELTAQDLINEALGAGKPFEPKGETRSEQTSWANLFRGAVGAFRNPAGHREEKLTQKEAIERIIVFNLLLRKLKKDYPEHFNSSSRFHHSEYTWFDVNKYALREEERIHRIQQQRQR